MQILSAPLHRRHRRAPGPGSQHPARPERRPVLQPRATPVPRDLGAPPRRHRALSHRRARHGRAQRSCTAAATTSWPATCSPSRCDPGKFDYRLVHGEIEFDEPGAVEAHCRIDQGPVTVVPYTLLPSVDGATR
ncbi:MAG: hypothetical protein U5R31_00030 [Acidimicrobiia bacterium]|nr:hypothetical protein [Acidimicrobiia bacterium]